MARAALIVYAKAVGFGAMAVKYFPGLSFIKRLFVCIDRFFLINAGQLGVTSQPKGIIGFPE